MATSAVFLPLWLAIDLLGASRRAAVVLAVFGFVSHVVFGKAYTLVPSYLDVELAWPRAPAIHLPFAAGGTVAMAVWALGRGGGTGPMAAVGTAVAPLAGPAGTVGAAGWALGALVFATAMLWSARGNPLGARTGTSDANAERRPLDRVANGFMPVAVAYFALAGYAVAAARLGLPTPFGGYFPRVSHLVAAGGAATMLFAVGYRLLPRFTVTHPSRRPALAVLPCGAVAPVLLALDLNGGAVFHAGAALEAVAVLGFAHSVLWMYRATDRDRVGFHAVALGAVFAVAALAVALHMAFAAGPRPALAAAHMRLNLLGFLGLTIVGVAFQFYPPAVGDFPLAGDETARVAIALLAGGLAVDAAATVAGLGAVAAFGRAGALAGGLLYAWLIVGLFVLHERTGGSA